MTELRGEDRIVFKTQTIGCSDPIVVELSPKFIEVRRLGGGESYMMSYESLYLTMGHEVALHPRPKRNAGRTGYNFMTTARCHEIRAAFSKYLQAETEVLHTGQVCLISLPIRDIDGGSVEVFIEDTGNDSFWIHDAGRTFDRLATSGLKITDTQIDRFSQLVKRLGVGLRDGVFEGFVNTDKLQETALSVGQCCSLALYELLLYEPHPQGAAYGN